MASACGQPGDGGALREASQHAIYGDDTRVEATEHPSTEWRDRATQSVAALISAKRDWWTFCEQRVDPDAAPTLQERFALCDDQRFIEQPSASDCSATLIDDDLVLTAAHCVETDEDCASTLVVFDYYLAADGGLQARSANEVHACRRRLALHPDEDAVVIELDRPVAAPHVPAAVAAAPPVPGDPLVVIGFPSGLPMKIAGECEVASVGPWSFAHNCDLLSGNSGSGHFDAAGAVVGVFSLVSGDYTPTGPNGCFEVAERTEEGLIAGNPKVTVPLLNQASTIGKVIDVLCDSGWPSERLCGAQTVCGDGHCSGVETAASCGADCPLPACGDGVCDLGEWRTCAGDCGPLTCADPEPPPPDQSRPPAGDDGGCSMVRAGAPRGQAWALSLLASIAAVMVTRWRRRRSGGWLGGRRPAPSADLSPGVRSSARAARSR